jgi:hypothetical protein
MKEPELITVGELRSMLACYTDDYLISFGDRYLAKVDNNDTQVVGFQWITKDDYE